MSPRTRHTLGVVLVLLVSIACMGALVAAWSLGQMPQRSSAARYLAIADGASSVYRTTLADGRTIRRSVNVDADSAASALAVSQAATFSVIRTLRLDSDSDATLATLLAVPAAHSTIVDVDGATFTRTETLAILDGESAYLVQQSFPDFGVVFAPALPIVRVDAAVGVTELITGFVSFAPSGAELPYTATLTLRERTGFRSSLGNFDDCLIVHSRLLLGAIDLGDSLRTYCADVGEVAAVAYDADGKQIEQSAAEIAAAPKTVATSEFDAPFVTAMPLHTEVQSANWIYTHTLRTASIFAAPLLADGRVFVGNYDGELLTLDAVDGRRAWRFQTGGPIFGTAAYADGRIVFGSADRRVYALQAASGTLLWVHAMPDAVIAAPTIRDSVVYVGDESGHVAALDVTDGSTLATFEAGGAIAFAPTVADDALFVASESGSLFALELRTLAPRWAFAASLPLASPPLVTDDAVLFAAHDEFVYAVARRPRSARGEQLWSTYLRTTPQGALALHNDQLLITSSDRIFAIDVATGARRWTTDRSAFYGAAVVVGDCAAAAAESSVAVFSLADGRKLATTPVGGGGRLSGLTATAMHLIVGTSNGNVISLPRSSLPCDAVHSSTH